MSAAPWLSWLTTSKIVVLELRGRRALQQQPADAQVHRRPLALGDERVGRLLHPVVEEAIGCRPCGSSRSSSSAARSAASGSRLEDDGQRVGVHAGAEAGGQLERLLRLRRQVVQLADHQLDDVVGVALRPDARDVPAPATRAAVERDQPVLVQRGQELDDEERVAAGLLVHQVGERLRLRGASSGPCRRRARRRALRAAARARGLGSPPPARALRRARASAGARGRPRCRGRRR